MRILTGIDVPFLPFGGSLICCDDWYSSLPEGYEARFLTLRPPENVKKWWSMDDVFMMDIEKAKDPNLYPKYINQLRKIVEEQIKIYKPDVIHCQHLNYGLSRVFAELDTTIPRIGICHGTDVQAAVRSAFFKDNLTRICDAMDLIMFPNQRMANDLFDIYPRKTPYKINPLGIPDMFFRNASLPPVFSGKGIFRVLYAGRLVDWKGADIAVKAMLYTSPDVHLTVIGNEDQAGYKEQMVSFVETNRLQERVTFLNQLPRAELIALFDKFHLMVLPSRGIEAFSLAAVEAQVRGLPIIYAKEGGGIVDTVGEGGILLNNNTPQDLARVINDVYHHPQLLREAQAVGMQNAQHYHLSRSRDTLLRTSTDLLRRN